MTTYTVENSNFDYSHLHIQQLLHTVSPDYKTLSDKDFAIKAYLYVRDTWDYFPYRFSLFEKDWKASKICQLEKGHCLDKAIIMISLLRARNIPARLGLAKVKNHIGVDEIVKKFGNDVLVPHGYVEVFLNNKWVKATPAFNTSLCEKLGVDVLEFDGENDSLFQPFDQSGSHSFMEYLEDYGTFDHVPLPYMLELMKETYPPLQKNDVKLGVVLDLNRL